MTVQDFFKDKNGNITIGQPPNILISSWVVLKVIDIFILHGEQPAITVLATATLFAWAYDELRRGDSPFRRVLGAAVMFYLIFSLFL